MQTLRVNELPTTMNKLNNLHFMQRAKLKEKWEKLIGDACWAWSIKPVDRVVITLELWFPDKRRRDLDGYSGLGFKFILDGLVKANILKDDNVQFVPELRVRYGGIIKPAYIQIYIEEV